MASQQQTAAAVPPNGTVNGQHKTEERFRDPKFLPNLDQTSFCNSPGNAAHYLRKSKRKAGDTSFRSWIMNHQIGLSLNLLTLLALTHLSFPKARRRTNSFFRLSYYHSDTNTYHQGPDDFYYVATWIVIFTGLRAAVMTYLLLPFAEYVGLKQTKTKVRFAEQAWLFLYYAVFWTLGMYLFSTSNYWLNFRGFWTDFPAIQMTSTMKFYYLAQFAFWLQQIVVVNIEERRKDHWQMFTHHIVTCALILLSLGYNQTRVGNVILVIMDVVDLTLPVAKMLKYTKQQMLCDIFFGIFILSWVVFRHIIYMFVVHSIYFHSSSMLRIGTYSSITGAWLRPEVSKPGIWENILQPYIDPQGELSFHQGMKYAFLVPLLILQGITIMWFVLICRIAVGVIRGKGADDSRSDDEEEEVEADEDLDWDEQATAGVGEKQAAVEAATERAPAAPQPLSMQPIEVEVPPEEQGLAFTSANSGTKRRGSPRYASSRSRKGGTSSGSAFAELSDRKGILDRIGCDKPAND